MALVMQEPVFPLELLESENPYPDCLSMELEAIPVQSKETQHFELYLSLTFNEQWESLLEGRIKFGLKGGELRLKLENCIIPIASRSLNGLLTLSQPSESPTEKVQVTSAKVITADSEENLGWVFGVCSGKPVLHGILERIKLGTVQVTGSPCHIEATFAVSKQDISMTDAEGLWGHEISPNKHGILERKLTQFLLATRLKPYLSWIQLGSEPTGSLVDKQEIASVDQDKIKNIIELICQAKTDNLLELASIADLNPIVDFAGANLLATNLSSIDFNGANLYRVNLRGADLTDADLSDTNLKGAKLSGADLSGAYLENADLGETDFHRASLALANLIGADLSGANLIEANLSNANLSSAKVEKTLFGNNIGLSEQIKLSLIERGAIFQG